MGQAESNLCEDLSLVCKRIEIRAYYKSKHLAGIRADVCFLYL
jgi:hypothetical protein